MQWQYLRLRLHVSPESQHASIAQLRSWRGPASSDRRDFSCVSCSFLRLLRPARRLAQAALLVSDVAPNDDCSGGGVAFQTWVPASSTKPLPTQYSPCCRYLARAYLRLTLMQFIADCAHHPGLLFLAARGMMMDITLDQPLAKATPTRLINGSARIPEPVPLTASARAGPKIIHHWQHLHPEIYNQAPLPVTKPWDSLPLRL